MQHPLCVFREKENPRRGGGGSFVAYGVVGGVYPTDTVMTDVFVVDHSRGISISSWAVRFIASKLLMRAVTVNGGDVRVLGTESHSAVEKVKYAPLLAEVERVP